MEALSQDGSTVAAMRGMTMAKSSYLFPSANLSPDSGAFPFFIWSLADLNGPANQFMIYQPSLFAGVTENTAWDGNNGDFYYGDTGNRVFLLLQQHYTKSISLWSCAAGLNQGTVGGQKLAEFPFTAVNSLAGQATQIEFAGEQVRVRVGASPLVSATTDGSGWVTYTGTNGSGRVTAPLGETRFWFTLAGGEKPGKREIVISDTPKTTTRFTYDGSPVTETSLAVTGPLTLTHDATIRARVYSAAAYRSPETVAVFTSTIPLLPAESFVSPAYMEILHATLDGSPALVSLSGPSGTTNGFAINNQRFILRYPLLVNEPTPVTLSRTTLPDLSTNIVWREIDLAASSFPNPMAIRAGDSLLFTAGVGATGTLHIAVMDGSNQVCQTREGVTGEKLPVRFDQGGTFTVIASVDGISVGSLIVHVVYIDFDGPVACQVGYKREKGVAVYGPTDQVFFTAKDPALLEVSVKEVTSYGVRLYLKALGRGTPVVQARLGSATGPILAEQELDEFILDTSAVQHLVVNGETDTANTILTMKPWIPNVDVNFGMYAHYSTFAGGATAYTLNTSDQTSVDINGDPAIDLSVDPTTGETQAVIRVDIEIPADEDSYCFRSSFDQHSKYGTEVGCAHSNGTKCDLTPVPIYIAEGDLTPHVLVVNERPGTGNVTHDPGPPPPATPNPHKHTMTPWSTDDGLRFKIVAPSDKYNCLAASQWNASVELKAAAKAGNKLSANICGTKFADVITVPKVDLEGHDALRATEDAPVAEAAEVTCGVLVQPDDGNPATRDTKLVVKACEKSGWTREIDFGPDFANVKVVRQDGVVVTGQVVPVPVDSAMDYSFIVTQSGTWDLTASMMVTLSAKDGASLMGTDKVKLVAIKVEIEDTSTKNFSPQLGETATLNVKLKPTPPSGGYPGLLFQLEIVRKLKDGSEQHVQWIHVEPSTPPPPITIARHANFDTLSLTWNGIPSVMVDGNAAQAEGPDVFTGVSASFNRILPAVTAGQCVPPPLYYAVARLRKTTSGHPVVCESVWSVYVPQVVQIEYDIAAMNILKLPEVVNGVTVWGGLSDAKLEVLKINIIKEVNYLYGSAVNLRMVPDSSVCSPYSHVTFSPLDNTDNGNADHTDFGNEDPSKTARIYVKRHTKSLVLEFKATGGAFVTPVTQSEMTSYLALTTAHEIGHLLGLVADNKVLNGYPIANGGKLWHHNKVPWTARKIMNPGGLSASTDDMLGRTGTWAFKRLNQAYLEFVLPVVP